MEEFRKEGSDSYEKAQQVWLSVGPTFASDTAVVLYVRFSTRITITVASVDWSVRSGYCLLNLSPPLPLHYIFLFVSYQKW